MKLLFRLMTFFCPLGVQGEEHGYAYGVVKNDKVEINVDSNAKFERRLITINVC